MSKVAIVFWSATGNTEAMADAVKAGAQEAGAEVSVFTASDFSADMVADFDAIAFGCPAMGDEVLEEDEFQPMFDAVLPSLSGKKIALLDNVSFKVKSGTSLALVGPSGGGKTTAAGLIARFWDVQNGAVKIGGVNVKDIPKEELMNTVSYVFQDSKLLKRSVLENVRLSRPDATEQEVMLALEKAQCTEIIEKLPDGIHTVIGAKGVYLSGGEQQRIAIARAILKDAPIVVLDEATAFADPENEYLVQNSFKELSKNKTVIMIAHRLSTIQGCDNIIVLDDGKISEQGVHGELLKKDGIYHKMWKDYQSSVSWKVGEKNA